MYNVYTLSHVIIIQVTRWKVNITEGSFHSSTKLRKWSCEVLRKSCSLFPFDVFIATMEKMKWHFEKHHLIRPQNQNTTNQNQNKPPYQNKSLAKIYKFMKCFSPNLCLLTYYSNWVSPNNPIFSRRKVDKLQVFASEFFLWWKLNLKGNAQHLRHLIISYTYIIFVNFVIKCIHVDWLA